MCPLVTFSYLNPNLNKIQFTIHTLVFRSTYGQWSLCWAAQIWSLSIIIRSSLRMCLSLFSVVRVRDWDVLNDQKSIWLTVLKTWKSHSMVAASGRSLLATPTHVGQKCLCPCVQRSWGRVREWGKGRDQTYPFIMKPFLHQPNLWVNGGIGLFLKVEPPWLSHLSRSLCTSPHSHIEG